MSAPSSSMPCAGAWERRPTRRSAPASRRVSPPASSAVVAGEKHDTGRQFTTAETIKAEKEIVQKMRDGQDRAPQIMSVEQAIPLTEARPHLNPAQRRAIEEVLTSRDRIQGLQGRGGRRQNLDA